MALPTIPGMSPGLLRTAALTLILPAAAAAQAPGSAAATAAPSGEPEVHRSVIEDDANRIEELRVRGQTRRIVVHSKLPGAPAYQIGTATDGRDVAQDRRSEGRSLWQVLSF